MKRLAEEELTCLDSKSSAALAKMFFDGQPWLCWSALLWFHRRKTQLKKALFSPAVTSVLLKKSRSGGFYGCAVVIRCVSVRDFIGVGATGSPRLWSVRWDYACVRLARRDRYGLV